MSLTEETCLDCPSYLTSDEAKQYFGDPETNFPMCARFGYLFGNSTEPDEKAVSVHRTGTVEVAACAQYGEPRPTAPYAAWHPMLFTPDTDLLDIPEPGKYLATSCMSCAKCNDEVGPGLTVRRSCKATGNLVTLKTANSVASKCAFGTPGTPMTSEARDDYASCFSNSSVDFVALGRKMNSKMMALNGPLKLIAGCDASSDAPVLDEHKGMIRAWRKATSPRGKDHFLPIFETSWFDEDEQAMIPFAGMDNGDPSLYEDHSNILMEFTVQSHGLDMNTVFLGEPGCGKTDVSKAIAWVMNCPYERIPYNEHTDLDSVLGTKEVMSDDGGRMITPFVPGILPRRIIKPGVCLSDEWNLADGAVHQVYREFNDSSRTLTIYGHKFRRHDYHYHLQAMNPVWDYRNIGAKVLASADTRRLNFVWMKYPEDAMQRKIIGNTVQKVDNEKLPKSILDCILKISKDIREASKQGLIPDSWTLSQDVKVARLVTDFGIMGALKRAYFDSIDPAISESVLSTLKSNIPPNVDWS